MTFVRALCRAAMAQHLFDDEDREVRRTDQILLDRSGEQAGEPTTLVRSNHDNIDTVLVRRLHDRSCRITDIAQTCHRRHSRRNRYAISHTGRVIIP